MGKETVYILKKNTKLTPEEIAMIEAARDRVPAFDEENPEIDPVKTPKLYAAAMNAVAERNRRITERLRKVA